MPTLPRIPRSGGGWHAIGYTFKKAHEVGYLKMWSAMKSRNACKTCAVGMGGQKGGMVNELGHFPEFCKKSIQAMHADLQAPVPLDRITDVPLPYLETLSPRQLEGLGRLTVPLVAEAGSDRFRAATWDEAMERTAGTLRATKPDDAFFYVSGRSSNEAGFLLHLFARAWGTNNVNNCSFYCHHASAVGLSSVIGSHAGTVQLDELDKTDFLLLIGANPASNHPRFLRTLMELRRRGGTVVVVNPLKEVGLERFQVPSDPRSLLFGTEIASDYAQIHIGSDPAFLTALLRAVVVAGGADEAYLSEATSGWPELREHLLAQDPAALATQCGLPQDRIDHLARRFMAAKAAVLCWAMGITHHIHGTDSVRLLAQLALVRGMVGIPGAGLMPLRGHSNIQGLGTIGVTPTLKKAIADRIGDRLGIQVPPTPGLDTLRSMEAAHAGRIRTAWCLGGNLYGSNPDATWAEEALGRIDQVVYLNTTLNTGHIRGRGKETWILPVRARDEEEQPTTQESMFSYVRLSDGGEVRHPGPRGEAQIFADLAARVLGTQGQDWASLASHAKLRELIAAVIPGLDQLASIGTTKAEFVIPGRSLSTRQFPTASGKAHLAPIPLPALDTLGERQVRVMTIRSEGQFNSVVYEDHDRYRGTERRDVLLMNPEDIARLGLRLDQVITVTSRAGRMDGIRVREGRLPPGNAAMYYPEANVLVPRDVDPESGTPAFKHVVVTLVLD